MEQGIEILIFRYLHVYCDAQEILPIRCTFFPEVTVRPHPEVTYTTNVRVGKKSDWLEVYFVFGHLTTFSFVQINLLNFPVSFYYVKLFFFMVM